MSATHRIDCPFPPCEAWWNVGPNVWQVPYHSIRGATVPHVFAGVFKCPGALVNFRFGTNEPNTPDRIGMAERAAIYEARVEEWSEVERERVERLRAANTEPETPKGIPEGREPDLSEGRIIFFPGRPADAPEPGPGERPAQPVDHGNVAGHHLGRAAVENAHDTTKALVQLAKGKMSETKTKLDGCAAALGGATGLATMAEIEVSAAGALVVAAVGSGHGKPQCAQRMAEQVALAVDTIYGPGGANIFNGIEVAKVRVEIAAQQLAAAIAQAEQYIALLS